MGRLYGFCLQQWKSELSQRRGRGGIQNPKTSIIGGGGIEELGRTWGGACGLMSPHYSLRAPFMGQHLGLSVVFSLGRVGA